MEPTNISNQLGSAPSSATDDNPDGSAADLPKIVREMRTRLGLSQEKLATKLGVSFATINRWENGRTKPSSMGKVLIERQLKNMGERGADLLERFQNSGVGFRV